MTTILNLASFRMNFFEWDKYEMYAKEGASVLFSFAILGCHLYMIIV